MSVIVSQLGYAQYDYATRDYCEAVVTIADGLQFQASIEDARNTIASQWQQEIQDSVTAGAQWRSEITKEAAQGTQFQSLILDALAAQAFQWQQVIRLELPYGAQWQGTIEKEDAQGAQFQSLAAGVESPHGLQWQNEISEESPHGFQFQYRIEKLDSVGVQFQSEIDVIEPIALQFQGFIVTESTPAMQFLSAIETGKTLAIQWQQKITDGQTHGMQFNSAIETASPLGVEFIGAEGWPHFKCGPGYAEEFPYATDWPYLAPRVCVLGGLQFTARREEEQPVALQWQQQIDVVEPYGLQFQGKIYEIEPIGVQFEAVSVESVGLQVRVAIYNDTNLRILKDFPSRGSDGVNWTASSTASSSTSAFSINNVNTDIVEQVWRSAAGSSATLTCDTQATGGVFVDTVALLNHNFSGGATVVMQYSDDNVSWENYANMLVEPENMYFISTDLPLSAHRYWRFIINDTGASFLQVGTIVFGSSVIFQGECFVDTVRFGKKQFKDQVFTEGHTNVSNDRGKKRFLGLEFQDLNFGRANFRQLRSLFDEAGTILKCLWIPTPQTPSRFAVFGKLDEIPEETHNTKGDDYVSLNARVDESL